MDLCNNDNEVVDVPQQQCYNEVADESQQQCYSEVVDGSLQ